MVHAVYLLDYYQPVIKKMGIRKDASATSVMSRLSEIGSMAFVCNVNRIEKMEES